MGYEADGTLSANGYAGGEDGVQISGYVTVDARGGGGNNFGSGTMTWQYKGQAGEWKNIIAGSDNLTVQSYTADHMANYFFGSDVRVRGNLTGSTSPTLDWEIMSSSLNRT